MGKHGQAVTEATLESRLPIAVSFLRPHFHMRRKRVLPLREVVSSMTHNPRLAGLTGKEAENLIAVVAQRLPEWCEFRDGKGVRCDSPTAAQFLWVNHDADYAAVLRRITAWTSEQ